MNYFSCLKSIPKSYGSKNVFILVLVTDRNLCPLVGNMCIHAFAVCVCAIYFSNILQMSDVKVQCPKLHHKPEVALTILKVNK